MISPYDFTINQIKADLETLTIQAPEQSFRDLEQGILRSIDHSPRMVRRGVYMLHKYPFLQLAPGEIKIWHYYLPYMKLDMIKNFCAKKGFDPERFFQLLDETLT